MFAERLRQLVGGDHSSQIQFVAPHSNGKHMTIIFLDRRARSRMSPNVVSLKMES